MAVTKHSISELACAIGLAISLVACHGNGDQAYVTSDPGPAETAKEPAKNVVKEKMSTQDQIAYSMKDLTARLDVEPSDVGLSGATPVTWRSGALGCPEPSMNYTQALVPGVWIMLRVGNTPYRYHAIPGGQPFYCPDDRAEPPVIGSGAD